MEFGKGAIVPRSSRETLARRYGDCKDQATLLVAMLRVAGIRAHVALLRTGRYGDVAPALPGLGDFDHAIVYVPGDRPLWIDPSARCAPAGYLPLMDQDRWAMLASPETRELIRTAADGLQDQHGRAGFRAVSRWSTARAASTSRSLAAGRARKTFAKTTPRWASRPCGSTGKTTSRTSSTRRPRRAWNTAPPLDLAKPFRVTAEVPDAQIGQFDEATATISLQPDGLFQRLPGLFRGVEADEDDSSASHAGGSPSDERKGPLLLPEPHIRQLQYRIHLPAGFTPKALAGIVAEAVRPGDDQPEV